ncbi:hypothetical protein [Raoultella planticola]|uniref:hypothetical protein n=1 Tax=Raoultella planticola TaxID=575 RepID=UPI0010AEB8D6|nr:hypothetical protein [Raoultella planticola]TJZ64214.1 hypothetical protein FA013_21925 [Raoultella planticola]
MRRHKPHRRTDRAVFRPAQRLLFRRTPNYSGKHPLARAQSEAFFGGGKAGYPHYPAVAAQ